MKDKKVYILMFTLLGSLLIGHIINSSILVLISAVFVYGSILVCNMRDSTALLFFFSPFSYIFAYKQYSLCIFLVVAYILKSVSKGKIHRTAFYTIFLLAYCLIFADYELGNVKLGTMIPPILISVLIFVSEETDQEDYPRLINFFKIGFIFSAIVGFFKNEIPSIARLFDSDFVNDSGAVDSNVLERFSGLTYDPNFFTVVSCVLIAIILFTTDKFKLKDMVQLVFLIIMGFFTFSKSYLLILLIIAVLYILNRSHYVGRNIAILIGLIATIVLVENFNNLDVVSVVIGRFESTAESGDLTTGRLSLWKEYIIYILDRSKVWFFGEGFNALAVNVKAVHNSYIDFVYRFGLIGTSLWIIYFVLCYYTIRKKHKNNSRLTTKLPLLVCLLGFMFLSAYHFQQLWCCICLSFFAMYIPEENKEKCLN